MLELFGFRRNVRDIHSMGKYRNYNETDDSIVVTSAPRILHYLREARQEHSTLTISCPAAGQDWEYSTRIRGIEAPARVIVLHQLLPGDWRQQLDAETMVEVACQLSSGAIRFNALLTIVGEEDGMAYCRLSLPQQVKRRQMRSSYRVNLARYEECLHIALPDEGGPFSSRVLDLSLGGLLCRIPAQSARRLRHEDVLSDCQLRIASYLNLPFAARVCRIEAEKTGQALLGLQFIDLSSREQEEVRQVMRRIERRNIRSSPIN